MKEVEARKLEMSQVFSEVGKVTPVTVVQLEKVPADLALGTEVEIVGTSKGKGFAGVMKRHGFAGLPATHGASTKGRSPGSIGGGTTPGRVYKGKKMPGRMGGKKVTVKGLLVVEVDPKEKIIKLSGSIPGPRRNKMILRYEPKEKTENGEQKTGSEEQLKENPDN
ncbi:MAG: hypothetical protein BMS9Abin34_223 [Patescibacteria group bacterium]|nr:MAG: hypothetical protein BMS9Abin34_223 [Patescibacteria group bacterium]